MSIVDTGVLVAAADRTDRFHTECVTVVTDDPGPLVTTAMVVAEAAYLFRRQLGSRADALLYTAITDGDLTRCSQPRTGSACGLSSSVTPISRSRETDASLVVIAERPEVQRIATLDPGQRTGGPGTTW